MKRRFALFLAVLLTALALTACGGGDGGGYSGSSSASTAAAGPSSDSMEYGGIESWNSSAMEWGLYDAEMPMEPGEAPEGQLDEGGATSVSRLANAKMVYTADIQAETMDFDACASGLETLVGQMQGYMEYAAVNSRADGSRIGTYTIRIPSGRFHAFLQSVGELSHVTDQSKSAENISERYYDTESRLRTQETKLERLQLLLAKAENMEDIIALESAIAETELQIEQLTGSLRHYDALVDYATIDLCLLEVLRLTTVEEAPPTFQSRLGNAFENGLRSFGDFLQDLAIYLAYNWTWLVLLAFIAIAVIGGFKRRQRQRSEAFSANSQEKKPKAAFFKKKEAEKPDDKQEKD